LLACVCGGRSVQRYLLLLWREDEKA
jgi:hypothetical protein